MASIVKQKATQQMALYREPTTVTCAEFEHSLPTAGWYRITGCQSNALDASFFVLKSKYDTSTDASREHTGKVMIPVYAEGDDMKAPSHIALLSRDDSLLGVVNDMNQAGFFASKSASYTAGPQESAPEKQNNKNDAALIAFAEKNRARIFTTRTIEGMVKANENPGGNFTHDDDKDIVELGRDHLAPQYVMFEEGVSPTGKSNDASMAIGLGAVGTITVVAIFITLAIGRGDSGSSSSRNIGGSGSGGNSGKSWGSGSSPSYRSGGGFVGPNTGQSTGQTTGQKSWNVPPPGGANSSSQPWSR